MAIIVCGFERVEVSDTELRIQAYRALRKAAERVGLANYRSGLYRGTRYRGYSITKAHQDLVEAMPKVLSGELDPEAAMNLLRRGDVLEERLG